MCEVIFKPHLSPRQKLVLELAGAGYTTSQIAGILGCSFHTITHHRRRTFTRLGAFNLVHALVLAHQWGIINVADIEPIRIPNLRD